MKVLVVGGGGREDAIVKKLKESPHISELLCAPGNGGIAQNAVCVPIKATDIDALTRFAAEKKVGFVVVGPDDPLCLGLVDRLALCGIPAFGPSAKAARIEGSKIFAKDLMRRYDIPTADYQAFYSVDEALCYLDCVKKFPVVIKADGLALGKGVMICETASEAKDRVTVLMKDLLFGDSGKRIVIEEFLQGPEVSMLCFTDGVTILPMVSCMDHKRILNGNLGPNTGGMGVIAPNPYYTPDVARLCEETIYLPTLRAMREEGCPFRGCLFFGLMLTDYGPKVIEYNCRFGDPETQAVLPLMECDLFTVMRAASEGSLFGTECAFSSQASCCVVLASEGYPGAYQTGMIISGIEDAEKEAIVYHAGTLINHDGMAVTAGGRVLGVTAVADTQALAVKQAYKAANLISFKGMYMRTDIGQSV